ncbi:MAG: hypothetical protein SVR94_08300 [Pseudomonadota bacterium]|nr:hypothetical protein [Pseudomonadota bacterium]
MSIDKERCEMGFILQLSFIITILMGITMTGILMMIPEGLDCIECGSLITKLIGLILFIIGTIGFFICQEIISQKEDGD